MTKHLLDSLARHLGLEVYFYHLLTDDGAALQLESHSGISDETARKMNRLDLTEDFPGAGGSQRVRIVADEIQRSSDPMTTLMGSLGMQAYVCYPLLADGHLHGTLAFGTKRRSRFQPRDLELLQAVSDHVALMLERGRLPRNPETSAGAAAPANLSAIQAREDAARADVEEANRARDEFLAVVSHKLRTPLNVMLGWVRMLQSPGLDAVQTGHALKVIERSIMTQTDLITDLLDVSRIVSGTLVLDMRPLDLLPIVRAVVDGVRPTAEPKGIQLQAALGGLPLRTLGDGARLRQIVFELLSNAVKFTSPGGGVRIELKRSGDYVRLIVSDTGDGIAPELLPRIFDRYRPRGRSSAQAYGGLGLGLTLVRRLVELHGGSIEATSAGVRRGATFTVQLPLRLPEREYGLVDALGAELGSEERLDLVRTLVVDDDPDTRDMLSVVLKQRGATVLTASSVADAYPLLTGFGPNVVLCDIVMSGEDGFRLLELVREDERRRSRRVPVIAMTAHARAEDRERILSAGFKGYLLKPLELSDVISMIRSVTEHRPGA